jgi:hypothetical protein
MGLQEAHYCGEFWCIYFKICPAVGFPEREERVCSL